MSVALLLVLWGGIIFGGGYKVGRDAMEGGVKICPGESLTVGGITWAAEQKPIVIRRATK